MKSLDLVNSEIKIFTSDGRTTHYSVFGVLLSWLIIILSTALSGYFASQLIDRRDPKSNIVSQFVNDAGTLSLVQKELFHTISFMPSNTSKLYLKIGKNTFRATGYLRDTGKGIVAEYDYDFCNYDIDAYGIKELYREKERFESSLCIRSYKDLITNKTYFKTKQVQEEFVYPSLTHGMNSEIPPMFYEIQVKQCVNGTNIVCADPGYIKEMSNQAYFFTFTDNYFDISNYTNPRIPFINSANGVMNAQLTNRNNLNILKSTIITDDGFLFETRREEEYWFLDINVKNVVNSNDGVILFFGFYLKNMSKFYKRTYVKAQEILANIGGVVKALMLIGKIISYLYDKYNTFLVTLGFLVKNRIIQNDQTSELQNKSLSNNRIIQALQDNTVIVNSYISKQNPNNAPSELILKTQIKNESGQKTGNLKNNKINFLNYVSNYFTKNETPLNKLMKKISALRTYFLEEENLFRLHVQVKKIMKHFNIDEFNIHIDSSDFLD